MASSDEYRRLLRRSEYAELKAGLTEGALEDLREAWPSFKPMEKLLLFKLLPPRLALRFFYKLDFPEKYFLLCGYELNSIAPTLEALPEASRALFVRLPKGTYDRMLRMLVSSQVEINLSMENN